jgi:hypothetical protein
MNSAFGVFLGQLVFPLFPTVQYFPLGIHFGLLFRNLNQITDQRHKTLTDRRPSTAAAAATGTKELKYCGVRTKIFCTGPTRAAKAEQKSLVLARQAQRTNYESISFSCPL